MLANPRARAGVLPEILSRILVDFRGKVRIKKQTKQVA